MKAKLPVRASVVALAAAPLFLVFAAGGCAENKPAVAAATPSGRATTGSATTGATASSAPATSGTVSISEEIRRACGIPSDQAYFAFDSSTLLRSDVAPLTAVARCFTDGPLKGRAVRLVGHTDPRGSSEYNLSLGQNRADSVQGYLDRHGVAHSRVAATSRGSMDATGQNETGWANDRRVDVLLGG